MLSSRNRASHESHCELVSFLCSPVRSAGEKECQGLFREGLLYYFSYQDFFFFLLSLCFLTCVMTCLFQADCSFKTEPYCDGECQGLLMGDTEAAPS